MSEDDGQFAAGDEETAGLVLVVVGAHHRAEAEHRPIAYMLAGEVDRRVGELGGGPPLRALVLSDIWYLNQPSMRARPTLSIGGPEVNALTAWAAGRVPEVFSVKDALAIHADLEWLDLLAAVWGVDAMATMAAAEAFSERYLDDFLRAAARAEQTR